MDEVETVMCINGYQHRIDDHREVLAVNVAALINGNRSRGDRRVKARDIFDREAVERERKRQSEKQRETPEQAAQKQIRAQERAARLPVPKKLREHRQD